MAASTTVTIWCNGCGDWAHTGHNAEEARRDAKRAGWRVNVVSSRTEPSDPTAASLWHPHRRRDFCPDCVEAGADRDDMIREPCTWVSVNQLPCSIQVLVPIGTDPDTVRCKHHKDREVR